MNKLILPNFRGTRPFRPRFAGKLSQNWLSTIKLNDYSLLGSVCDGASPGEDWGHVIYPTCENGNSINSLQVWASCCPDSPGDGGLYINFGGYASISSAPPGGWPSPNPYSGNTEISTALTGFAFKDADNGLHFCPDDGDYNPGNSALSGELSVWIDSNGTSIVVNFTVTDLYQYYTSTPISAQYGYYCY
jgi:hypothetical protein